MNAMKSLVVAALAAAGLAATADAQADRGGRSGWSGARPGHVGGHWSGGRGHWGGHRSWSGPRIGLYIGAPVLFGSWYWNDYYYPRTVVVERVIESYPSSYPEGVMEPAPTTEVPRSEGAPSQAPAYMNYCESANAYYPKVTSCPEGWKFLPSR
jgi:hypothetical protein